jgi:hypothetical protein
MFDDVVVKYKSASALRLRVNPFSNDEPLLTHFINSNRIVASDGLAFTFLSSVDLSRLPNPRL